MEHLNNNAFVYRALRFFYRVAPFDIRGGWNSSCPQPQKGLLSCLLIASVRPHILEGILWDLAHQTLTADKFEVVILNDGAGENVAAVVQKYEKKLRIQYREFPTPQRILSNLRNTTCAMAQGEFFLFLDDDTRILQSDFLEKALQLFQQEGPDIILPRAHALYGIVKERYDFLDAYSFTNRCSLFRRAVLEQIGGFNRDLNTYEDTEMSIRLMIKNFRAVKTDALNYFHPPLYFDSMRKPLAIGQTIFQMRQHYSWLVWVLAYVNALRFLPYGLIPCPGHQQWFKISLGVLLYPVVRRSYYY